MQAQFQIPHVCKPTAPNTQEPNIDKRTNPTHAATKDVDRCNVCLADVQLKAVKDQQKEIWSPIGDR